MFSKLLAREPGPRNLKLAAVFFFLGLFYAWAIIHEAREQEGVGAYEIATFPVLALLMFLLGTYYVLPGELRRIKIGLEVAYGLVGFALLAIIVWFLLT